MLKPELLAPAGNLTKLKIALNYGADAVYASVGSFSLRSRSAKEFTKESFEEGVKYTHEKGKKFYATINAFPFNGQIEGIKKHIEFLKDLKVDGFIVATPGVMKLCKDLAPEIDIHLSTQANVMNYLDAELYYELGASRIVAAREMNLKDAVTIKKMLPQLELEIFCHGSMCFAYSGRCLISSLQSGRIANRGSCANDCRFKYDVFIKSQENEALMKLEETEEGTYLMNSKDLNLVSYVEKIMQTDAIDCFKIEGRTKSEYYVACTTKTYRKAIDDAEKGKFKPEEYEAELNTLKNRGFTDGYIIHKPYEREDTQNYNAPLEAGSHETHAITYNGEYFMTKYKLYPNIAYEIFTYDLASVELVDNEIGKVFEVDGKKFMEFKKLLTESGKEFSEIHSGNLNPIQLPTKLPQFSFLRKEI